MRFSTPLCPVDHCVHKKRFFQGLSGFWRGGPFWPGCCESSHQALNEVERFLTSSFREGEVMIAATALAVVGLVVVAFLNRIP